MRQRGTVAIHPDRPELPICRDMEAHDIVGVQIGHLGHRLWVCVDGQCVLRVRAPEIEITDLRNNNVPKLPA